MSKKVRCALCGSDDYDVVCREAAPKRGKVRKIDNVICNRCGLIYNNPMMTDEFWHSYYKNDFIGEQKDISDIDQYLTEVKNKKSLNTDKLVNFVREFIDKRSEVLDIGCGVGKLLYEIEKSVGCEVSGVEPDNNNRFLVDNVENCTLDDFLNKNEKKYDLIILKMVLEHLSDPNRYIEEIKKLLKPNGYIFIVVPNAYKFRPSKKIVDNFLFGHVYSYTPYTICQMLLKHGMKVVKYGDNHVFHDLKVVATDIKNKSNSESIQKMKGGGNIRVLKYRIKYHSLFFYWHRIKKRIINIFRKLYGRT